MRRNFLLTLAWDGTDFEGWQRGPSGSRTVQAEVESALSALFGEAVEVTGASRTDAGVHAEGQAASFHARTELKPARVLEELNRRLPPDLVCRSCREVDPRFHARYRARGKLYRYRLHVADLPDPFSRRYSLHVGPGLDLGAMRAAAALFVGDHDWSAFTKAKAAEGKDPRRRVESVEVRAEGDHVDLLFSGDAFLYNQVRIMAAALLEVGKGSLDRGKLEKALAEGKRELMPGALGPFGLCLMEVHY